MTQRGAGARGQDRRAPPSMRCETSVADRVDAAVHRVQAAPSKPVADRAPPHSQVNQLPSRDHAMLPLSDARDHAIPVACPTRGTFGPYLGLN
jgi:hypothetical protein